MLIFYSNTETERQKILSFIQQEKNIFPGFRVIDIGGATDNWSSPVVDCLVDINASGKNSFNFNISIESEWSALLDHVKQNGKFHFAICTHTIEDISNPQLLLRMLPMVAERGVISAPSILAECSRVESNLYLGYIHHRHLVGKQDNKIVLAPKLNFIHSVLPNGGFKFDSKVEEVVILWKDKIDFEMIMNDYLGPNAQTVVDTYRDFIQSNINDIKNQMM